MDRWYRSACVLLLSSLATGVPREDLPPLPAGAKLLDNDIVGDLRVPGRFVLSPGRDRIAYQSAGFLWSADCKTGRVRQLTSLPGALTAIMTTDAYRAARARFNQLGDAAEAEDHHPRRAHELIQLAGLKCAPDGKHVHYMTIDRPATTRGPWTYNIMCVSPIGDISKVAEISRDFYDEPRWFRDYEVTADGRSVIIYRGLYRSTDLPEFPLIFRNGPLIWDVKAAGPRATRFRTLVASPTSNRFLGVEIDTHQLVLTNERLEIIRRYPFRRPPDRYSERVAWSPDERYAVFLSPLPLPARRDAEVVRYDLETGESRTLLDGDITERFVFTGKGGEAMRYGLIRVNHGGRADGGDGSFIARVPDGDAPEEVVLGFSIPPRTFSQHMELKKRYDRIAAASDGSRFVVALPRDRDRVGFRLWLVEADGSKRPVGPDDPTRYTSPYHVLAFVNDDTGLLAYDGARLFVVPIDSLPPAEASGE